MAYVKQTWVNGVTPIDAAHMNHIEEGLANSLQSDELEGAVNDALAQAKESGAFDGKDGVNGKDGAAGKDGVSVTHSWSGTTLTVTSASGTSSADLRGADGQDGVNGSSVTVKSVSESSADGGNNVVTFSDGKTLNIKNGNRGSAGNDGAAGKDGADGKTPVKGTDYFTAADKAEMTAQVKAALTSETWTFTLSDGSTVTKKVYVS